ncbi:MFS general substrate transporter [Gonapodya prolifera JEL478]|uniref:Lysosomal dipeptide transporter MFSD1 n=1 Tax=Gonapodya prolifera (strain JEL478) TaxID=1344416 RepID=A0A139ALX5_GONPJ|nr:MFS general substrate transporter [Gonapodya prolifera JEL478]|eukprot:KXS17688.1 MFS general substrate transporter [Gonapodya prolifera JEL478]
MEPEIPPSPTTRRLSLSSASSIRRSLRNSRTQSSLTIDTSTPTTDRSIPLSTRAFALLCIAFLALGSHVAANILSSLKSTLKRELGITNAQFHVLNATYTLVGTTLPIMIGMWVDRMSTTTASLTSTTLITVGELFFALAPYLSKDAIVSPFTFMLIGRVVLACGASSVTIVQQSIIARIFGRDNNVIGVGVALGVQIAVSRLSGVLALGTAIPLAEAWGFYGIAFWVSFGVCAFSWLINLLFVATVGHEMLERPPEGKKFQTRDVLRLPLLFWLTVVATFFFHGILIPFGHTATELISSHSGTSDAPSALPNSSSGTAGWVASIMFFIPFLLSPISGHIMDRFNRRVTWMIAGAGFLCVGILIIGAGWTQEWDMAGMSLFGLGYTVVPIALLSSIPLVVAESSLGTALGIYKCYLNLGATIFDPVLGKLQDTAGGQLRDSYVPVIRFLAGLSVVAGLVSLALWIADRSYGCILERGPRYLVERRESGSKEMFAHPIDEEEGDATERLLAGEQHVDYSDWRRGAAEGSSGITRVPTNSSLPTSGVVEDIPNGWADEELAPSPVCVSSFFVVVTFILLVGGYLSVLVIGYQK